MKKLILVLAVLFMAASIFGYESNPPYPYNNSDIFQQYVAATEGVVYSQPAMGGADVYYKPLDWSENYSLWKVTISWNPHTERYEEDSFEEVVALSKRQNTNIYGSNLHNNQYGQPKHSQHPDRATVITQYYNGRREIVIRYEYDVTIADIYFYTWEEID